MILISVSELIDVKIPQGRFDLVSRGRWPLRNGENYAKKTVRRVACYKSSHFSRLYLYNLDKHTKMIDEIS